MDDHRASYPYNAGMKHTGSSSTGQTLFAAIAKHRQGGERHPNAFGLMHEDRCLPLHDLVVKIKRPENGRISGIARRVVYSDLVLIHLRRHSVVVW